MIKNQTLIIAELKIETVYRLFVYGSTTSTFILFASWMWLINLISNPTILGLFVFGLI